MLQTVEAVVDINGKVRLPESLKLETRRSERVPGNSDFGIAPLDAPIIAPGIGYDFNNDPFDAVIIAIIATAAHLKLRSFTKRCRDNEREAG